MIESTDSAEPVSAAAPTPQRRKKSRAGVRERAKAQRREQRAAEVRTRCAGTARRVVIEALQFGNNLRLVAPRYKNITECSQCAGCRLRGFWPVCFGCRGPSSARSHAGSPQRRHRGRVRCSNQSSRIIRRSSGACHQGAPGAWRAPVACHKTSAATAAAGAAGRAIAGTRSKRCGAAASRTAAVLAVGTAA